MNRLTALLIIVAWISIGVTLGIKWEDHNKTLSDKFEYGIKLCAAILFCPFVLLAAFINQVIIHPWK